MSNKILTAVFVVLFVVLLGEAGYFFYFSRNQATPSTNTEVNITPTPTIIPRNGKQAVASETIEEIKKINAGVLKKSILQNTYSGKIIEIETNGNSANNIHYGLKIRLMGDNNETNTFYYNDDEVKIITVNKNNGKNNLTVADLKAGDSVIINETSDMMQDLNHSLISNKISIQ